MAEKELEVDVANSPEHLEILLEEIYTNGRSLYQVFLRSDDSFVIISIKSYA
jgi:hypothetical protein